MHNMHEVARRAGVSLGTVSNVLNHPELVSEETRVRVQRTIDELGFVRNGSARHLRVGSTQSIGLMVLDVSNPFFTEVARGAEAAASERDYIVILCNSDNSPLKEKNYLRVLGAQLNYTGDIAILSATSTATNQNAWIDFMKQELSLPKYANMKLVKIAYGNDDDQTSYSQTQALVQAYPNLKGIISPTTVGIAAAARYLEANNLSGKIALTGLGTPNGLRKYVKDGTIKQFELWDVGHLGYLAYYAAAALVQGKITGKAGDTFTAGTLGSFTVGANGTVLLGKPTVFDSTNIDQFNF